MKVLIEEGGLKAKSTADKIKESYEKKLKELSEEIVQLEMVVLFFCFKMAERVGRSVSFWPLNQEVCGSNLRKVQTKLRLFYIFVLFFSGN